MTTTSVYLVPYHSQPGLHVNGSARQFAIVEKAIVDREWPYDNGDDPSFYVARKGGPLTWGVCRENVRNRIQPGSIVVFFSFSASNRSKHTEICYRLAAVATVEDRLDRRAVYSDARFRCHRHLYLNILIRKVKGDWEYDESDRDLKARHRDWLWRIAVHGKKKQLFESRNRSIYKTGCLSEGHARLADNYILFSAARDKTYISPYPAKVAQAVKEHYEKEEWNDDELRQLTVERAGQNLKNRRDYLRTANPTGRNVHPEIRFDLPFKEANMWRQSLISTLRKRDRSEG